MSSEEIESLKEHIKAHVLEVSTHYAGGVVRRDGKRFIFRCPRCGKDTLHTFPEWISGPITGCWNEQCSLARSQDALTLIADMESLDNKREFMSVLEQGARITGAASPNGKGSSTNGSSAKASPSHPTTASSTNLLSEQQPQPEEDPELSDAVYKKMLSMCALSKEVWEGLKDRGLKKDTILDAGINYLTAAKGGELVKALGQEFGKDLLRVPGFYESEKAQAGYWSNFAGKELILFPYYDAHGLVSTIEGRVMFGKEHTTKYKYLSFTGSGSHLYLFPGMGFGNIEGICEGLVGAIVAAQEGVCVASIQGFRRYRATGGKYPLPQLVGVDFGGRVVVYIPDMDDPPKLDVAGAAPDAARWLIERQNGTPLITLLPSGKDLDEFLLTVQPQHRRRAFDALVERFSRTPEVYEQELADGSLQSTSSPASEQSTKDAGPQSGQQTQQEDDSNHTPTTDEETTDDQTQDDDDGNTTENTEDDGPGEPRHDSTEGQSQDAGATDYAGAYAPAAGLTGEQFYRDDFDYPDEPPDPYTAIFGKEGQQTDEQSEHEEKNRLQATRDSLCAFKDSLKSSTWKMLKKAATAALELFVIWAVIYVSLLFILEVLTPLGALEGMWKVIAVAVVVCALLRVRLARRRRSFLAGALVPGKK